MKFNILGNEVEFSEKQCFDRDLKMEYLDLASKSKMIFTEAYNKCSNMDDLVKNIDEYCTEAIRNAVLKAQRDIQSYGIWDITADFFLTHYGVEGIEIWNNGRDKIVDKYCQIVLKKEELAEYRKERKACRGKWQGGGFGVKGAIKGAATASAMNAVTGVAHSLVNAVGNTISSIEMNQGKVKLFEDENTLKTLTDTIYDMVLSFQRAFYKVLHERGIGDYGYENDDIQYCKRVVDNIDSQYEQAKYGLVEEKPDERVKKAVLEALVRYPYNGKAYLWLMLCYGDQGYEVSKMAEYFGIDISEQKKLYYDTIMNWVNYDDLKTMENAEKYLLFMQKKYLIDVSEGINRIRIGKEEYSRKKRTVYDLQTDYEAGQTSRAQLFWNTEGVIMETEEEANAYTEAGNKIKDIYSETDLNDLDSVQAAYLSVEKIVKKYGVGEKVLEELGIRQKAVLVVQQLKETSEEEDESEWKEYYGRRDKLTSQIIEKKEMEEIETYKKEQRGKTLEEQIHSFVKLSQKSFTTSNAKKEVLEIEKQIISSVEALRISGNTSGKKSVNAFLYLVATILGIYIRRFVALFLSGIWYYAYLFFVFCFFCGIFVSLSEAKEAKADKKRFNNLKNQIEWDKGKIKRG